MLLVLTLRLVVYTLFGKNVNTFGQKFLHPQKYAIPYTYGPNYEFAAAIEM